MMTPHPAASWPPIRTGVCRAGRSVPSRYEKLTGPGLPSSNQPDRERTTAYRDSSGPISRSDAYCATIVGDWQEPSGECRLNREEGEYSAPTGGIGSHARQADPPRGRAGKLLSPARRRACADHVQSTLGISERRACAVLGQHRSTQRKDAKGRPDEDALTRAIIALASEYGRYGYRRIWALLRMQGWGVGLGRVERIWRREGLKVPSRQPKRGRLWLNDGSCIRLRPSWQNHVWSVNGGAKRDRCGGVRRDHLASVSLSP